MNSSLFSMKKVLSLAIKPQVRWEHLKPLQLARFSVGLRTENFEGTDSDSASYNDSFRSEFVEKSLNEINLLGIVGEDPVCRFGRGNFLSFTLGTKRLPSKSKTGESVEGMDWHTIVVSHFRLTDKIEKIVSKGTRLYVTGKLIYSGDDKQCRVLMTDFIKLQP